MEIFNATNLLYIWGGFVKTIEISALSIFFSLIFGTVLALVKSYAPRPFRILVSAYIELFRCTPNLLWILFIYFTVQGLDIVISTIAFTLFTSTGHQLGRVCCRDCARRPQLDSARPV